MKKSTTAAALALGLIAGCTVSYADTPAGKVIDRGRRYVVVLQDDGKTVTHHTTKRKARGCSAGERWPDC